MNQTSPLLGKMNSLDKEETLRIQAEPQGPQNPEEPLNMDSADLGKKKSAIKRRITAQMKVLREILKSEELTSRTKIRFKMNVMENTLQELDDLIKPLRISDVPEDDLQKLEDYFAVEQDRVLSMAADVQDHLESRCDEATTDFGSNQDQYRRFQMEERQRLRKEIEINNAHEDRMSQELKKTKSQTEEMRSKLEELELGDRKDDFKQEIPNTNTVLKSDKSFGPKVSWMAHPTNGFGGRGAKSSIKTEMMVYQGKPLEFTNWSNMFHSLVHCTSKSAAEKMGLLRASLGPTCQKVVEGFSNTEEHYHQALSVIYRRFGNEKIIRKAHIQAIRDLPSVRPNDPDSFTNFADQLQGHLRVALSLLPRGDGLLQTILEDVELKLDRVEFMRWRDFSETLSEELRIDHFADWVMKQADKVREHRQVVEPNPKPTGTRSRGSWNQIETERGPSCKICRAPHKTRNCARFKEANPQRRGDLAREHGMCFICLEIGHRAFACSRKNEIVCRQEGCGRRHHTWLHQDHRQPQRPSQDQPGCPTSLRENSSHIHSVNVQAGLGVIPVRCSMGSKQVIANALVDEGSDTTIVSERIMKELGIPRPKTKPVTINLVSKKSRCFAASIQFEVAGINDREGHSIIAMTLPKVCKNLRGYSWKKIQSEIAHLADLPLEEISRPVELLIGADNLHFISPMECRGGTKDQPFAMRCELGWVVRGRIPRQVGLENMTPSLNWCQGTEDSLETLVRDFFNSERFGSEIIQEGRPVWSQEEAYGMKLIEQGTRKIPNEPGYEASLPWKSGLKPKNDPVAAEKRFESLKKKMASKPEFAIDYKKAINVYLDKGYAQEVTSKEEWEHPNQRWLPHHGVYKNPSSRKVRVVFDSAAKFHGLSLNDCLYTGPKLQGELLPLLVGFREYPVGVTADIEAMYSRIRMNEDDARYHRFLWEDDNGEIKLYQMTGVVFGDSPSPCQAIHTLSRTAEDFGSPEILDLIEKRFYMDDYVNSFVNEKEAITTSKQLVGVLQHGNFHLGSWLSNSEQVLKSMEYKKEDIVCQDVLSSQAIPRTMKEGQVLGMTWKPDEDCLGFALKNFQFGDVVFTRRGLLRKLAGVFDPLGLVAPFTVKGKIMMQKLSKMSKDWDEELDPKIVDSWRHWVESATHLREVKIPRCLFPKGTKSTQLHVFCDASVEAFAAVAYVRIEKSSGEIETRLVLSKTRVAPVKPISIAKLELNGALLGARIAEMLGKILREPIERRVLWTDSTAVLGWIQATASY